MLGVKGKDKNGNPTECVDIYEGGGIGQTSSIGMGTCTHVHKFVLQRVSYDQARQIHDPLLAPTLVVTIIVTVY